MKTRRAASLIELLIVMTACTSILTTSAVLLHRVMHAHTKSRNFFAAQRSSLRLADQFRRDVHRATAAPDEDLPEDVVLRLRQAGDQTVDYRHVAGIVSRELRSDDRLLSREEFAFPPRIELVVRRHDSPVRVSISIECDPNSSETNDLPATAASVHFYAEACLARDARYPDAAPESEASP